jgi:hypothetical protein
MNQYRLDYLTDQLDKVRRAAESARSPWSQQWMHNLENRLIREIQRSATGIRAGTESVVTDFPG